MLVYSATGPSATGTSPANPRVSLHLADDGDGGDLVVLEGVRAGRPEGTLAP